MKISLSPEIERLIAEKLKSGRYGSADEVIREGLGLLEEREKGIDHSPSNGSANIGAAFEGIAGGLSPADWDSVPPDLSKNLDHYLYGGGKTS